MIQRLKSLSIKARVTLLTLATFIAGLWILFFFIQHNLQKDIQHLASEQQYTTANIVANEINEQLNDRINVLKGVATLIDSAVMADQAALQAFMMQRPGLERLFNQGFFITDAQGEVIASLPIEMGRVNLNYSDLPHIAATLKDGKTRISSPLMGKLTKSPVFHFVTPILDSNNNPLGSLVGAINLAQPNFLDKITRTPYGKTGGYVLIDATARTIITATNSTLIMKKLPEGENPLADRFMLGFEGSGISSHLGMVEVLASGKSISAANWRIIAMLPTDEAFAPIKTMQQRTWLITLLLSLLTGLFTWWMIRRELSPLIETVHSLANLPVSEPLLQPPSATNQNEIGLLIEAFNQRVMRLSEQQKNLILNEQRLTQILDQTHVHLWAFDGQHYTFVNKQWFEFTGHPPEEGLTIEMWTSVVHPDDIAKATDIWRTNWQTKSEHDNYFRLRRHDGVYRDFHCHAFPIYDENGEFIYFQGINIDITERKHLDEIFDKRVTALVESLNANEIALEALLNIDEMQRIQDEFASTHGVASIITKPDGTPFTKPSNFTQLCNDIIRTSELGCANCMKSDAIIGRFHPQGPIIQSCSSGGLWDAGASITVCGHHIANWLIGQVRNSAQSDDQIRPYARLIGVDEERFMQAYQLVPQMTQEQFNEIANDLFVLANHLPERVFHDPQQAKLLVQQKHYEKMENFRNEVMAALVEQVSLERVLETLIFGVQKIRPEMLCSVLLLGTDGKHFNQVIAPNLPNFYNTAIQGIEIGMGVGSCGTAAFTGKRVVAEDIQTHPYWASYKALAEQAGLGACWSQPILGSHGQVLGTFAIYHHQAHTPDAEGIALIEQSASLASIAIEQHRAKAAIIESEERFRSLADAAPTLIWVAGTDKLCNWFNQTWLEYTGRSMEQEYGNGWAEGVHAEDFDRCLSIYTTAFDARQSFQMDYRLRRHDGEYRWFMDVGRPRFDSHGQFVGYIGMLSDISDRKQLEDQVQQLAYYDALTNLPNRRLLEDRLTQAMAASKRSNHYGALMFLDLDNFKPLNDTHGHAVGDLLLIEVAKRLRGCVREMDTVARLGGDEFVVVLTELSPDRVTSTQQTLAVAEKIRLSIAAPFLLHFAQEDSSKKIIEHQCTTSIGVVMFLEHQVSLPELMKCADAAMYQAKDNGRNLVYLHSNSTTEQMA